LRFFKDRYGALTLFGVPPEEYWAYNIDNYDKEPPAFCYSFAKNYQAISYVRIDPSGVAKDILLQSIKDNISKGFPCMFGFTVYNSIQQSASTGKIPYPSEGEKIDSGHAVVAVGYDDKLTIKNEMCDKETKRALFIRNSWGVEWGEKGYGYLPYDYVTTGLAEDCWTLIQQGWVDTAQFGE